MPISITIEVPQFPQPADIVSPTSFAGPEYLDGPRSSGARKKHLDRNPALDYFALGLGSTSVKPTRTQRPHMTKTNEQRDLFPGALEIMILRTLKRQPLHGYALVQHIKRASNDLLQIEEGSLYPALQRLLKDKLVSAEWSVSSTNRTRSAFSK